VNRVLDVRDENQFRHDEYVARQRQQR